MEYELVIRLSRIETKLDLLLNTQGIEIDDKGEPILKKHKIKPTQNED